MTETKPVRGSHYSPLSRPGRRKYRPRDRLRPKFRRPDRRRDQTYGLETRAIRGTRPASTSEIMGTERIRSPPTFATGSHFSHFTVLPHISRLNLKGGGGKKTGEGNGRNMGGDGERTEKEKEGDPPTRGHLQLFSRGCAYVQDRVQIRVDHGSLFSGPDPTRPAFVTHKIHK